MKRLLSIGLALLLGTAATAATAGDYRERHYDDRPYHRYDRDVGWERHDDWRRHNRHDRYWRSDRHWRERDWRHAPRYGGRDPYWPGYRFRAPHHDYPRGAVTLSWRVGHPVPPPYFAPAYYVDHRHYGLRPPPYGCRWLRVDRDLLLVDLATRTVLDVLYRY